MSFHLHLNNNLYILIVIKKEDIHIKRHVLACLYFIAQIVHQILAFQCKHIFFYLAAHLTSITAFSRSSSKLMDTNCLN